MEYCISQRRTQARRLGAPYTCGYGEEVREASKIAGALQRARESVAKTGKSAVINIWVDPTVYAPGTMAQTMYK